MSNIAGVMRDEMKVQQMIGKVGRVLCNGVEYVIVLQGTYLYRRDIGVDCVCKIIDKLKSDEYDIVICQFKQIKWLEGLEASLYSL